MSTIAILGDYNPSYSTHLALNRSIEDLRAHFNKKVSFRWFGTDTFDLEKELQKDLRGVWLAPGSPYKDENNVLRTIHHLRKNNIPTLGNCGGFQYMLIEFARNVCGLLDADHEESNPTAATKVITRLSCSLVEEEEALMLTGRETLLHKILQTDSLVGRYYCNYGLNPFFVDALQRKGMRFTAQTADGQYRAFELPHLRFYMGTLFQPALDSETNHINPILKAFVQQCIDTSIKQITPI